MRRVASLARGDYRLRGRVQPLSQPRAVKGFAYQEDGKLRNFNTKDDEEKIFHHQFSIQILIGLKRLKGWC